MIKNFNTALTDINGNELKELVDDKEKSVPILRPCLNALLLPQEGDEKLDGKKKCELVQLALKINHEGEIDLSAEEIVMLKQRVGKLNYNNHMVIYRIYEFLDPK